jgi:hypothetical protein
MDIQLGSALDENTRQFHHLVLVKHGLRILQVNRETGLPDETRCFNIGFAQIGQMDYDYGVLQAAQAAGDLEALQVKGRRALRLHIEGDVLAGLQKLLDAIELAGERRR